MLGWECDISVDRDEGRFVPEIASLEPADASRASRNNETLMNHNGDYDAGGNTALHRLQEMLLITRATPEDGAYIMSWCARSCSSCTHRRVRVRRRTRVRHYTSGIRLYRSRLANYWAYAVIWPVQCLEDLIRATFPTRIMQSSAQLYIPICTIKSP